VEALDLHQVQEASEIPVAIHGTTLKAWNQIGMIRLYLISQILTPVHIAQKGLSVMGRNHIHIAAGKPGTSGVISGKNYMSFHSSIAETCLGMRTSSQILIYIDAAKAMADGIKFYISANGVILTKGNEEGFLLKEYFLKVERANGTAVPDSWKTS
jgi:2'-phosphotransferase